MRGWLVGGFWIVACFGWFLGELVVHSAEWTTGAGLFLDFGLVSEVAGELVVHSMEWTTGAALFLVFGPFSAFSWELVVHSTEWTTGSELFLVSVLFWAISGKLVVHSTEWTTGAALFLDFGLVSDIFPGASGPLDGVDHWRGTLHRFWLGFGGCLESFLLWRRLT